MSIQFFPRVTSIKSLNRERRRSRSTFVKGTRKSILVRAYRTRIHSSGISRVGNIDRICENPKGPTMPSGEARLSEVGLGAVTTGTRDGEIERGSLLFRDLVPIAKNSNEWSAFHGRNL